MPSVRAEVRVVPEAAVVAVDVGNRSTQCIGTEPDRSGLGSDDGRAVSTQHVLTVVRVIAAGPARRAPAVGPRRRPFNDERRVDTIRDPALGPSAMPSTPRRAIQDHGPVRPPPRIGSPSLPGTLVVMPAALGVPEPLVALTGQRVAMPGPLARCR